MPIFNKISTKNQEHLSKFGSTWGNVVELKLRTTCSIFKDHQWSSKHRQKTDCTVQQVIVKATELSRVLNKTFQPIFCLLLIWIYSDKWLIHGSIRAHIFSMIYYLLWSIIYTSVISYHSPVENPLLILEVTLKSTVRCFVLIPCLCIALLIFILRGML